MGHFNIKNNFHDVEIGSIVTFGNVQFGECPECVADVSKVVCNYAFKYLGHSVRGCEFEHVGEPFTCPHCGYITNTMYMNCTM